MPRSRPAVRPLSSASSRSHATAPHARSSSHQTYPSRSDAEAEVEVEADTASEWSYHTGVTSDLRNSAPPPPPSPDAPARSANTNTDTTTSSARQRAQTPPRAMRAMRAQDAEEDAGISSVPPPTSRSAAGSGGGARRTGRFFIPDSGHSSPLVPTFPASGAGTEGDSRTHSRQHSHSQAGSQYSQDHPHAQYVTGPIIPRGLYGHSLLTAFARGENESEDSEYRYYSAEEDEGHGHGGGLSRSYPHSRADSFVLSHPHPHNHLGSRSRDSRASHAALTSALQLYRVPEPQPRGAGAGAGAEVGAGGGAGARTELESSGFGSPPRTPDGTGHPRPRLSSRRATSRALGLGGAVGSRPGGLLRSASGAGGHVGAGYRSMTALPGETMDALVDIHRVLYRGAEDLRLEGRARKWPEQGSEVRRVIDRWCEGDCVYDHPLIRLSSRDSVFTHFILLHLLSSAQMPSLTPAAMVYHARRLAERLRLRLGLGRSGGAGAGVEVDVESAQLLDNDSDNDKEKGKGRAKGKSRAGGAGPKTKIKARAPALVAQENERLARIGLGPAAVSAPGATRTEAHRARGGDGLMRLPGLRALGEWYGLGKSLGSWTYGDKAAPGWKLWEVNADCKEIGGMECYDGFHLALIEHVVTLTFLPALVAPRTTLSQPSSFASLEGIAHGNGDGAGKDGLGLGLGLGSGLGLGDGLPLPLSLAHTASTPMPSFMTKLMGAMAREFEYLLKWELPMSTFVEFNEVGKATHIRDVIDVQDLIETFVPFAKRLSWLTRRVGGFMCASLGSAVLGFVPGVAVPPVSAVGGAGPGVGAGVGATGVTGATVSVQAELEGMQRAMQGPELPRARPYEEGGQAQV